MHSTSGKDTLTVKVFTKKVQEVIFFIVLIYYIFVILKTFKNNTFI